MEPDPPEEKSVDEVLDAIDWEKLGAEGVREKAELLLPAQTEPPAPARMEPPPPAKTEPSLAAEMQPPPPAHVQLFHRASDMEIVRSWFGWQTLLVTAFTVIWDVVVFANFRGMMEGLNLLSLLFPAIGVVLAYYTIARWLNRTRIVVSRDKITVRHGPLPWIGNKEVEASNLKQVYRVEQEHRSSKGGRTVTYEVYTLTGDGQSVKLLDGLTGLTSEQALFIALQIEKYLGIQKIPAEGRIFDWLP